MAKSVVQALAQLMSVFSIPKIHWKFHLTIENVEGKTQSGTRWSISTRR